MWCGKAGPELAYGGEREKSTVGSWCELYVNWSPQGQYLATFHRQGIALWVGDDFQKVGRMKHPGVKHVEWSPCERYVEKGALRLRLLLLLLALVSLPHYF